MFRLLTAGSLFLSFVACGQDAQVPVMSVNVVAQGLQRSEVANVEGFVLGPRDQQERIVTCLSLGGTRVAANKRVNVLASDLAPVSQSETAPVDLVFLDVGAGADRLVVVDALGSSDELVGRGCRDAVLVEDGKTTEVDIVLIDL